jgi:anhydro-N-acetylmuramic acid kinase
LFIGLMSGTSLDGVDAVLAECTEHGTRALASHSIEFSSSQRSALLALQAPQPNELELSALAANQVAQLYAQCVLALLKAQDLQPEQISALGAHGQTVRHQPSKGFTLQLLNAALLAELTQIRVAYDFRARDVAAGGQGAPLVPAFHLAVFGEKNIKRAIVNIGGIANISLLDDTLAGGVAGHDCGPGNVLMDGWCERYKGMRYDANGSWAASGKINQALLAQLLKHPFLARAAPKSTGRDDFHMPWLEAQLALVANQKITPVDVQATLLEFTCKAIANACSAANAQEVFLCGGGAQNGFLAKRLLALLPKQTNLSVSDALGVPAQQVEAMAFAWLAYRLLAGLPGNLAQVTGAAGPRVLGSLTR